MIKIIIIVVLVIYIVFLRNDKEDLTKRLYKSDLSAKEEKEIIDDLNREIEELRSKIVCLERQINEKV